MVLHAALCGDLALPMPHHDQPQPSGTAGRVHVRHSCLTHAACTDATCRARLGPAPSAAARQRQRLTLCAGSEQQRALQLAGCAGSGAVGLCHCLGTGLQAALLLCCRADGTRLPVLGMPKALSLSGRPCQASRGCRCRQWTPLQLCSLASPAGWPVSPVACSGPGRQALASRSGRACRLQRAPVIRPSCCCPGPREQPGGRAGAQARPACRDLPAWLCWSTAPPSECPAKGEPSQRCARPVQPPGQVRVCRYRCAVPARSCTQSLPACSEKSSTDTKWTSSAALHQSQSRVSQSARACHPAAHLCWPACRRVQGSQAAAQAAAAAAGGTSTRQQPCRSHGAAHRAGRRADRCGLPCIC